MENKRCDYGPDPINLDELHYVLMLRSALYLETNAHNKNLSQSNDGMINTIYNK